MKKMLSMLLALALTATLAACGKKDEPLTNDTPASSETPAASSTPTPPKDEPLLPIDPYADVPEDPHFFYFYDDKDNIIVEQYTGTSSIVRIPAEFEGLPVTEIGNDGTAGVFQESETIEVVIIPEGVTRINENAFIELPNLKTIIFPSTLQIIRFAGFANCDSLTEIILPEGLYEIKNSAFSNCDGLITLVLPESLKVIHNHAFSNCKALTTVTLPDNIESMEPMAFNGNMNIQLVYRGTTYLPKEHYYGYPAFEELSEIIAANNAA